MVNTRPAFKISVLLTTLIGLGACHLAPEYQTPKTPLAAQYRTDGPWRAAQPSDQLSRDGWWRIYNDPQLNDLQQRLLINNPDLAAALAHYAQAQAFVTQVQSGYSLASKATPTVNVIVNPTPVRCAPPLRGRSTTRLLWVPRSITRSICGAGCATQLPPVPMKRKRAKPIWPMRA